MAGYTCRKETQGLGVVPMGTDTLNRDLIYSIFLGASAGARLRARLATRQHCDGGQGRNGGLFGWGGIWLFEGGCGDSGRHNEFEPRSLDGEWSEWSWLVVADTVTALYHIGNKQKCLGSLRMAGEFERDMDHRPRE
jgi:hypothetical protein